MAFSPSVTDRRAPSVAQDETRDAVPPLAWALLALSAAWCVLWFLHARGYWEDDAWIHLEFARSVAEGRSWSFNGHIVYGDTSPMWVWLLDLYHWGVRDWMIAGKTLTVVAAVVSLAGAFALARTLTPSLPRAARTTFAAAMVLLFVTNPYFGYWAFSGMEALAAAGLVCWGLVIVSPRQLSPLRFLLGCICAGIAPLLRPEMSFFTVLLGLVLLQRLWTMAVGLPQRMLLLSAGFAFAAGPALAWARFALHTFGMMVPNTNAAKRAAPTDSVVSRLLHVYALGFPLVLVGVALLLSWWVWSCTRRERPAGVGSLLHAGGWLLFVWTAINCVFYVLNHTFVQTRYIFVTAPVLTIALMALAVQRWPRLYRAALGGGLLFGIGLSFLSTWPLVRNKVGVDRDYAALAAFLRTLPPDAPVANYSIGECAYLSEHPLVDLGGITRPGVIPYLWDTEDRRVLWAYGEGARYAAVDHSPMPGSTLVWHRDIPSTGWFLNPKRYEAKDRLELWKLPDALTH